MQQVQWYQNMILILIIKTIDKILEASNITGMRIIDANWGMYERDLDMTKYIADKKREDFYVTFCGIAKNSIKYTPEIAKIFYEKNFLVNINKAQPLKLEYKHGILLL